MTDEPTLTRAVTAEPLVTLCGPYDYNHKDVVDLATGLRFIGGKAVGIPLSVAEEIANRRRGYYIEPHGRD